MAPAVERHGDVLHLGPPALGALHILTGDHAIVEDPLGSINVRQKLINGLQALHQSALQNGPFLTVNESWQWIEGKDPLSAMQT